MGSSLIEPLIVNKLTCTGEKANNHIIYKNSLSFLQHTQVLKNKLFNDE